MINDWNDWNWRDKHSRAGDALDNMSVYSAHRISGNLTAYRHDEQPICYRYSPELTQDLDGQGIGTVDLGKHHVQ